VTTSKAMSCYVCDWTAANQLADAERYHEACATILDSKTRLAASNDTSQAAVECDELLKRSLKVLERDPYAALKLPHDAQASAAKKAYRRMALAFHPG
jgi:hypothetical protein